MIEFVDVTKRYGSTTVVDAVSMTVERGSITTIVGTSGSGKSTLLRMINKLVPQSEGTIRVNGRNIADVPATELRRQIGYVIQGNGLFPHRTVAQNIATVPQLLGWQPGDVSVRVEELLALFGLDSAAFATKYPHELSGGQQQRVGVARALAARPELLLMDEPFGALDPVIRGKAQDDLKEIQQRLQTTILLVTHDMDEAFRLGDRIAVMSGGRLLQYASPEDIIARPADDFVEELTGTAERSLKRMALFSLRDRMEPAEPGLTLALPQTLNLKEALAELIWQGTERANVHDEAGNAVGSISMHRLIALGRHQ